MIALNLSRTELELLVSAIEFAGQTHWPTGDDRLMVQVLRKQLEKAIAELLLASLAIIDIAAAGISRGLIGWP